MNTAGIVILVLVLLAVAGGLGWIIFTRWRAQRLGLPPPPLNPFQRSNSFGAQPARGGVFGWFSEQTRKFRNRNNRTATGAYEGAYGGGGATTRGARGFGALDPDEAWDTRVGAEAEYEYGPYDGEELGSNPQHRRGGGADTYDMNLAATPGVYHEDNERGRPSRSRTPPRGGGGGGARGLMNPLGSNPFDDDAEPSNISMRGVSPRPIDTSVQGQGSKGATKESPTERRSLFKENI